MRELSLIIKTNTRVASSVGPGYIFYLRDIFQQLIQVYNIYSTGISQLVS